MEATCKLTNRRREDCRAARGWTHHVPAVANVAPPCRDPGWLSGWTGRVGCWPSMAAQAAPQQDEARGRYGIGVQSPGMWDSRNLDTLLIQARQLVSTSKLRIRESEELMRYINAALARRQLVRDRRAQARATREQRRA
jgi:hypothetical protein